MRTTIIVPCYNEEKRLPLDKFKQFVQKYPDCSLLFVNDGSKDNTLTILNGLAKEHQAINVLDLLQNAGKAEAVRQGMLHAINTHPVPDFVAFYDADMATPASDLYAMIQLADNQQYHMVVASRILRLGGAIDRTFIRGIMGRVFANAASYVLCNLTVYDTQCGAKVFRAPVAQVIFAKPFITNWIFDVELFARMIIQYGLQEVYMKVYEFPLSAWRDVQGSKVSKMDFIRQIYDMYKIKKHYKLSCKKK
ncbi:MAG: glycosyltransferase family 2 protein [Bacteroidales bacterium]|jgi:glycosyltransferase involved in cell wall biosynthesis|nr:glycosyltransferase family 2 protein [Bacteroidales bacterium]